MTTDDANRRLFFALWPSEALRRAIEQATVAVAARAGGRIIPAEDFHITLIFLGSVPEPRLHGVLEAASQVTAPSFELRLSRLESWRRSGVLCLTAEAPAALEQLRSRLRARLEEREFRLEDGPFQPHVTLVRRLPRSVPAEPMAPIDWEVEEFVLVESRAGPLGSSYEVLQRWPLSSSAGSR